MPGKSKIRLEAERAVQEAASIAVGIATGRYIKAFDRRAHGYALLGHTDEEIADLLGIHRDTLLHWKSEHPSFAKALRSARTDAYVDVVRAVHRAAKGYRHRETKLHVIAGKVQKTEVARVYPPSMDAAKLLLSNRQGDRWRANTASDSGTLNLSLILERAGLGDDAKPVAAKVLPAKDDA